MSFAIVRFSPITVADSRDKANTFRRSSILFQPPWFGGAAGYRPRSIRYYARVCVHSPEGQAEHMSDPCGCEGAKVILRAVAVYFYHDLQNLGRQLHGILGQLAQCAFRQQDILRLMMCQGRVVADDFGA